MKIAVLNQYRRRTGGVETYLDTVLPALAGHGHELLLVTERDEPLDRPRVAAHVVLKEEALGGRPLADTVEAVRAWHPDVLYLQGLADIESERALASLAPMVVFAHVHVGGCISGTRCHQFPRREPCDKVFGPACLFHYLPRRCGGLSPVTMLREYQRQQDRLALLRESAAVVVSSPYMAEEYRRQGLGERVQVVGLPVTAPVGEFPARKLTERCELLYLGRLERLKGVDLLLAALPEIQRRLGKPVRLTVAGDGQDRSALEAQARTVVHAGQVDVRFIGWAGEIPRAELLREAQLLVVPSVWQEPFGLAGVEAALTGLPAAAFAVGGIPAWLTDGVSGALAPAHPPTAAGLADAVERCVSSEQVYERLVTGARRDAERFSLAAHLERLLPVFATAIAARK